MLNSVWVHDDNIFSSLIVSGIGGFIAAYLLSFILAIRALLVLLLFGVYIISSLLLYTVKEIFGLFFPNSSGLVSLKIYRFTYGSNLDNLSGWQLMS